MNEKKMSLFIWLFSFDLSRFSVEGSRTGERPHNCILLEMLTNHDNSKSYLPLFFLTVGTPGTLYFKKRLLSIWPVAQRYHSMSNLLYPKGRLPVWLRAWLPVLQPVGRSLILGLIKQRSSINLYITKQLNYNVDVTDSQGRGHIVQHAIRLF